MPEPIYAYFDGIEGSCIQEGREGSVTILSMDHTVEIPVDVKDATATGTRRHGGIVLVANIDKATPLLYECVTRSKTISTVRLEYWQTDEGGNQVNYYTINLEKVRIVKVQNWFPNVDDSNTTTYKHMMTYELRYDKIEWAFTDGNIAWSDEWKKPNV